MTCDCSPTELPDEMFDALVSHLSDLVSQARSSLQSQNPQSTIPSPCPIKPIPTGTPPEKRACYYLTTLKMLWGLLGCYQLPVEEVAQCVSGVCSGYDSDWEFCEGAGE